LWPVAAIPRFVWILDPPEDAHPGNLFFKAAYIVMRYVSGYNLAGTFRKLINIGVAKDKETP
jgi:hypothetical protein